MTTRTALALLGIFAIAACTADTAKTADTMAVAGDTAITPAASTAEPAPAAAPSSGMVDPNTASAADLEAAKVPAAVVAAVVAGRPYKTMVDVDKVLARTLSEALRDSAYARVWIPIDPNTASDAEILLIPGVGARMLREFKEYRPWTSSAQFRREIGKYVDNAEVGRLETYIVIK